MKRKFYKEIWSARFAKMLHLEEQSVADYQALLDETKKLAKDHAIIPHFEKLIADEKKHAILVKELMQILDRQPV